MEKENYKLGKIIQVPLREVWKNEAYDFTQWLAEPANIEILNDTIGLTLVDIKTEKNVGAYKCDIVCHDEMSNKIVIIENQLESSNHDHLGKIVTYASGLDASVIIWIVKEAREEHSSAIEWLNNHTDESVAFFLLEAQLWKIGSSDPALKFNVVEEPNDFNRIIKKNILDKTLSENQTSKLEFWTAFNDVMRDRKEFNIRKPSTDHWYDFSIGKADCHLVADLLNKKGKVRINMWISDNKERFEIFSEHKEEIENAVGEKLNWERLDGKKACKIFTYIDGLNFNKPEDYHSLSNKIIDKLIVFRKAFKPFL